MSRPRIEDIEIPASASDGDVPTVVGDVLEYVPAGSVPTRASDLTTAWVPLTTTVGGVPDLIWTSDDELIYAEVPIP